MKVLTPVAAVQYEDGYGDEYEIQIAHDDNSAYPWVLQWEGEYDTFTTDGLRTKVNDIADDYEPCEDSVHDEDDDDYEHDEDDCPYLRWQDRVRAWQHVLRAAEQFEFHGKVTDNLGTVAHVVLEAQADYALNLAARYPHAVAVFSFDADRETIRNAVIRALEAQHVEREYIDQFGYEASTNADILSVAQRWVTCS